MEALINVKKEIKNNLIIKDVLTLMRQKIEATIVNGKSIVISTSNSFMACRNTIQIEDYEFDDDKFYVNCENFELHIKIDDIHEVKYDDLYNECFTFLHNDNTEINLCFL